MVKMSTKIRYAYCKICKKEVEESRRKPLEMMPKVVWGIAIVATIGLAAIAYAVYLSNRPKSYCPTCFTKLEYSDTPFEKPRKMREDMTPKEKILDKAGLEEHAEEKVPVAKKPDVKKKEKKDKKKKIICSYCGEELDEDYATCPFCQAILKT